MPVCEPDFGISVCSRVQGTSFSEPWFIDSWVLSDSGTLSHFAAGKVLQAWTILVPHTPVQAMPEIRKNSSTTDIEAPIDSWSDFHSARPLRDRSGTRELTNPRPFRGHQR